MSKEHSLGRAGEELVKGTAHLLLVQTILSRQETEAVGLKINQGVADDQRPPVRPMIKCDFTGDSSFDFNDLQFPADRSAVFCFCESRRFQIGKALRVGQNWDRKAVRILPTRS